MSQPCTNGCKLSILVMDRVLPTVLLTGSTDIMLPPWLAVETIDVIQKCSSYQMCF